MPRKIRKAKAGDRPPDYVLTLCDKFKFFFAVHWRGFITILLPLLLLIVVIPGFQASGWVAYTLLIMAAFWVTECIPIPVTSFLPFVVFPLTNVSTSSAVARAFVNETVCLFLGSLFLAYSVEQSGLHRRIAYKAVRTIGYSHAKLLLALCCITTFCSLFISNTAATTMMVPINFAVLRVFEENKVLRIYEPKADGELKCSDITACYFCTATYCATIGGIGTLIATGTNLVFKGLFMAEYPTAPEYLSFPLFSAFTLPLMVCLIVFVYFWMSIMYLGLFRPNSKQAKRSHIPALAKSAAKIAIDKKYKLLGYMKFHEYMIVILFGGAMVFFFCRRPQIFTGWADLLFRMYDISDPVFIQDSSVSLLATFLMIVLPNKIIYHKYFKAKYIEDIPKKAANSVLNWALVNKLMPYSFMFLIGGGFAISSAAKTSGLNDKIAGKMDFLQELPLPIIFLLIIAMVIFFTNFASNIAVANVFVPIGITLAKKIGANPLWCCVVVGITCSFCFMMPVATPGNLIVQVAAKMPAFTMVRAGSGVSLGALFLSWVFYLFWAPVIWPVVKTTPEWMSAPPAPPP